MKLFLATVMAIICILPLAGGAQQRIDMALVLAVDTSRSVDNKEYSLQMAGMAAAFRDPSVQYAITTGAPSGLAVTLVQWSASDEQEQVIPWTLLTSLEDASRLADRISRVPRAMKGGKTALGEAMAHSIGLIDQLGPIARRNVIDISGDGGSNEGRLPQVIREQARAAGIIINGIAILNEEPRLNHYFRTDVIVGTGAFIITATDYVDFARAIRMKLIREIVGTPIAMAPVDHGAYVE
ncbi:DUF1194 domain-containing protein [Minwuia sp.]|uniref:DUF1194 domain-containing protein n=1 Tax=Minwuia sp. TaxID=2493630 RepID=UPI003A916890